MSGSKEATASVFLAEQLTNARKAGVHIVPHMPRMAGWAGASYLSLLAANTQPESSAQRVLGKAFASALFFGAASPLYAMMTSQLAAVSSARVSPGYALNRFLGQTGPMLMAEQSRRNASCGSRGETYLQTLQKLTLVNGITSVVGASRIGEAGMVEQQLFASHKGATLPELPLAKRGVLGVVLTSRGVVFDLAISCTQDMCRRHFPDQEILAWTASRGVAAAVATPLHAIMVYYIRENGQRLPALREIPRLTLLQLPSKVAFQLIIGVGWGCLEQLARNRSTQSFIQTLYEGLDSKLKLSAQGASTG